MWSESEEIVVQLTLHCLHLSSKYSNQSWKVGVIVESEIDDYKVDKAIDYNLKKKYGRDLGTILYSRIAFIRKPQDIIGLRLLPIFYCSQRFWRTDSPKKIKLSQDINTRIRVLYGVDPQYIFGNWAWGDKPYFSN